MFHSIHCNRRSLQCLLTGMYTVSFRIARDDLLDCGAHHITTLKGQVIVNRNVKDEKHLKTKNASTNYRSSAYYASVCK